MFTYFTNLLNARMTSVEVYDGHDDDADDKNFSEMFERQ